MTLPLSDGEFTLHRYYLWANRMRGHLLMSGVPPSERIARRLWLQQSLPYFALWLSLLHVVMEGWDELKLYDQKVDSLMESPSRDLLRRLRNGAFHFQVEYYDARFMEFIDSPSDPLAWATELHQAIGAWFIDRAIQAGVEIPGGV